MKSQMQFSNLLRLPLWVLALAACWSGAAEAAGRIALLIGNVTYPGVFELQNPARDARALASRLKALDFDEILVYENLAHGPMLEAIEQFIERGRDKNVRILFFSGHGGRLKGGDVNYLIPIDAISGEMRVDEVRKRMVSVGDLLSRLNHLDGGANIVMLDTCRNVGLRSPTWFGFSPVSVPQGSIVSFATMYDSFSIDGLSHESAHSPYVEAVLKHISTVGLDVREMFRRVASDVKRATKNVQKPEYRDMLDGPLCLKATRSSPCGARN